METFLSMFYSLVLLIETINTYVICIWGYISFNSRNIDKKKQLAEAEVAEAEMEIIHTFLQNIHSARITCIIEG